MKSVLSMTMACLLGGGLLVAWEAPVDPREAELERLVQQSPKLHLGKLLDYNLEKLEAVFRAAHKAAHDKVHKEALEASHKAWLDFFAADGVVAGWNAEGGSAAYPAQMAQKIYQVRLRIHQLATPAQQGWPTIPRVPYPKAD